LQKSRARSPIPVSSRGAEIAARQPDRSVAPVPVRIDTAEVTEGTYRTAHPDGSETSECRLPDQALSAIERGAVRGLYVNWDIEITVCFDERDAVESHFVGAWNAGI
jgi:hypothetical protein